MSLVWDLNASEELCLMADLQEDTFAKFMPPADLLCVVTAATAIQQCGFLAAVGLPTIANGHGEEIQPHAPRSGDACTWIFRRLPAANGMALQDLMRRMASATAASPRPSTSFKNS